MVTRGSIHGEDVLVALPQTYMNLSGNAVQALASFYRLEPAHIVVLHDELDFEPGVVRIKWSGGHGGNNGIRSIIEHLGRDFVRVRIGVGKPPSTSSGADYVLSRFDAASRVRIDEALVSVADAVDVIVRDGVEEAMNTFNRRT